MIDVTDDTFDSEVLKCDQAVIVDFWAPWCGPCKSMIPIIEAAEKQFTDVKFVKVNVDDCSRVPATYGVRGIPTFIIFNKGDVKETHVGSMSSGALQRLIDTNT